MDRKTFNVTWEPYEGVYIIVCPDCGEYVYWKPKRKEWVSACSCGWIWKVRSVAVGKKACDEG